MLKEYVFFLEERAYVVTPKWEEQGTLIFTNERIIFINEKNGIVKKTYAIRIEDITCGEGLSNIKIYSNEYCKKSFATVELKFLGKSVYISFINKKIAQTWAEKIDILTLLKK